MLGSAGASAEGGDVAFDKIAAKSDHGVALPISVADGRFPNCHRVHSSFDLAVCSSGLNDVACNVHIGYEGLVTRALLSADFESAVNLCFNHGRLAEAVLLAVAGGQDLLTRTQRRFFSASKDNLNKVGSD